MHLDRLHAQHIVYVLLLVAHIAFVWWIRYFPTQDGPSHIYNLVILSDLINGGKEWGRFFSYDWQAVPNLGFHIIAYPLLNFFAPFTVEKIFISLYIVLMGISVPIFLRTFGKPVLPAAFFLFPVIFNFTLMMGFYSYCITIPLFLLAFSLAWQIRNASSFIRFFILNLASFALFYFHLIPFIVFLIALGWISITEPDDYKGKLKKIAILLMEASPSIFLFIVYAKRGVGGYFPDFTYLVSSSRFFGLLADLLLFSMYTFSPWQVLFASTVTYIFSILVYLSVKSIYHERRNSKYIAHSDKILIFVVLCLITIYLSAPISFGNGSYFNQRFPWIIYLLLLPLLRFPESVYFRKYGSIVLASVVTVFFACNAVILFKQSAKVELFLSGLNAGLPKGALVMTYKAETPDAARVDVLLHAASYYGVNKGCVDIGNYELGTELFPTRYKDSVPLLPSIEEIYYRPATINFSAYPGIQYLLAWRLDETGRKVIKEYFNVIYEEDTFTVWKRRITQS